MADRFFEMQYYETYYYLNIVYGLINYPVPFLRSLEDFFGDLHYRNFLEPFPKCSAMHSFIEFVIRTDIYESIDDVVEDALIHDSKFLLWIEHALRQYRFEYTSFREWISVIGIELQSITRDTIFEYHSYLEEQGILYQLIEQMVQEIFFILFLNREFLRRFNEMIASRIAECELTSLFEEDKKFFDGNGILKRVNIPSWVRRAIFYRDRGLCSLCKRDISGLATTQEVEHFDHIVPLGLGGINDVSNIQLLCRECNLSKGARSSETSKTYERWYR